MIADKILALAKAMQNGLAFAPKTWADELLVIAARVADVEKDAARYWWLRGQCGIARPDAAVVFNIGHDWVNVADGASLDRDCDAAIKEQAGATNR